MSKAIILVAFGSSNIEGVNKSIGLLEKDLTHAFGKEYTILKAFTSKNIINALKEKHNISIPHITKALFNLGNNGYSEVIIQPLHMMKGKDHRELEDIVKEYRYSFNKITLGNSLIGFEGEELTNSSKILASAISSDISEETIILAGHGSKEGSDAPYIAIQKSFNKLMNRKFYMATLEGEKRIDDTIKELDFDSINEVLIKPLFIIPGKHVLNDLQSSEDSWTEKLNKAGIKAKVDSKSLLENENVRKIFIENIRKSINK